MYEVLSLPKPQGKINLAMLSLYTAYVDLALGTSNLNDTFLTRHALRFPPRQRWVGTKRAKLVIIYKKTQLKFPYCIKCNKTSRVGMCN